MRSTKPCVLTLWLTSMHWPQPVGTLMMSPPPAEIQPFTALQLSWWFQYYFWNSKWPLRGQKKFWHVIFCICNILNPNFVMRKWGSLIFNSLFLSLVNGVPLFLNPHFCHEWREFPYFQFLILSFANGVPLFLFLINFVMSKWGSLISKSLI